MSEHCPVIVLGGSGYVAGEFLRLIAAHPYLELAAVVSDSQAGHPVSRAFAHLAPAYPEQRFTSLTDVDGLLQVLPRVAVFAAAPHGVSAKLLDDFLARAETAGTEVHLVDASADYRFADADAYLAAYGHAHGAPSRLADFASGLPEHVRGTPAKHVGHPGCFATSMLLAIVPLLELGLSHPEFYASGVTGSTGAGRQPTDTTHHPQRHSNLFAYKALAHRHSPEVCALAAAAAGVAPKLHFVPHSGPFARGIEMTVMARLKEAANADSLTERLRAYYAGAPFVHVVADGMPGLKDVAGSNHARLGVACDDDTVVVSCVIDNLLKGAAGGSVQWMNRLLGWPETTGLDAPAPGWI